MKSIALGQYYPSDSVLHRLDPRIKVILTILYIVCSFLCKKYIELCFIAFVLGLAGLGRKNPPQNRIARIETCTDHFDLYRVFEYILDEGGAATLRLAIHSDLR